MSKSRFTRSSATLVRNTPTQKLLDGLNNRFAQKGMPFKNGGLGNSVKSFFSLESLEESQYSALDGEAENLENTLTEVIAESEADGAEFTEAQKTAAVNAGVAAAAPREFMTATANQVEGAIGVGDSSEGDVGRLQHAIEAYDETENKNAMHMSVLYNLRAARQDDFGEAFFPTIVAAANESAVFITCDLFSVLDDIDRALDGSAPKGYEFGRKNLLMALRDPSILYNDTTKCHPVFRAGQNEKYFVDQSKIAASDVVTEDGYTIKTAPLKIGTTIPDYIGLCAPDHLVEKGTFNRTDALDSHIQMKTLYVEVGGEVLAFRDLDLIAGSDFTYVLSGKNRAMQLNNNYRHLTIDEKTKKADGGDSAHLAAIVGAKQQVKLSVNITGGFDLETGRGWVSATDVEVVSVFTNEGDRLDMTQGAGKAVVDLFTDVKVIAYELNARRINSNRRERGQQLELHQETRPYSLPILSPISIIRPTGESDNQDAGRLDQLVSATYIRCTGAAVDALLRAEELISTSGEVHNYTDVYAQESLGMARFLVQPWYAKRTLDVQQELQTLRSAERLTDLTAVLVNAIREQVYSAYWESGYKACSDIIYGPGSKKPIVVIGTDANIINYLMVTGDFRTLGNEFDVKLVSTNNIKMKGKIRWSFGRQEGVANDLSNPLHFGNMIWRPELTSILPVVGRQNTFSRELTVQPSFRHIHHLPIMGAIDIVNMPEAVVDYKVNSFKTQAI